MRAFALVALLCAPCYAAPVHLQTLEHVGTFDAIPTVKRLIFAGNVDFGTHQFVVNYEDSDLGVTTWEASEADIRTWFRQSHADPQHTPQTHSVIIGSLPSRSLFTGPNTIPMNFSGTFTDGAAVVTYIKVNHTSVFAPTALEMELSPFTQEGGKWKATQTVRVYGHVPEPECGGMVVTLCCVGLLWATGKRARG